MLKNKLFLITGANGDVGISISKILLQNDANLILFFHKHSDNIKKLIQENPNFQQKIESFQVDLLDSNQIQKTMLSVLENNSLDGFVHSVSLPLTMKSIFDFTWSEFEDQIYLQTKSFFILS